MADESVSAEDAELMPDGPRSQQWKKPTESFFLVKKLARQGLEARQILAALYPRYCSSMSDDIPDAWIMQLLRELCEQRTRQKLVQYNSFGDAVELFRKSKRIMVITGAGVSVSCGIPDFRSENGVYARLKKDFPELSTPTAMFDIDFFRHNPRPFYAFAKEIFPGQFCPSLSHMFIKFLEEEGKLLRNYTQNIDTLERMAGISNLVECHGSFARATCLTCKHQVDSEQIRAQVLAQRVAHCPSCVTGVLKPDIVFFGEDLGEAFHDQMGTDHAELDLLVVIGSSMQVRPVSLIPYNIGAEVPQILINRQLLRTYSADIKLLGNSDSILVQIALAMGGGMREKMLNELRLRRDVLHSGGVLLPGDLLARVKQLLHRTTIAENVSANTEEEEAFLPRQISVQQFKQFIGGEEDGTARKKLKMEEEETANGPQSLWQGNYALVETHLPSTDTTLFVPPNLNVFVGAELFYDRDQDTFVHRMGIKERRWDDDDDDEDWDGEGQSSDGSYDDNTSSSSSSSAGGARDCSSVPSNFGHHSVESLQGQRKTESCPPTVSSNPWPKK